MDSRNKGILLTVSLFFSEKVPYSYNMRHWWVNQNQTFKYEISGGFMWSPFDNANGARNTLPRKKLKKTLVGIITLALTLGLTPSSLAAAKVFKNCTEMNKIYPGGVALPGAINSGGATKKEPKYNKALYIANKKSDRDKDGIACEK